MNVKKVLILLVISIGISVGANQVIFAEPIEVSPGIILDSNQVLGVIAVGVAVSVFRVLQGYQKSTHDFDKVKAIQEVQRMLTIAIPLSFANAIFNVNPNPFVYFTLFWTVWGLTAAYSTSQRPTIPSSMTDEQIDRLRKERAQ